MKTTLVVFIKTEEIIQCILQSKKGKKNTSFFKQCNTRKQITIISYEAARSLKRKGINIFF